MVGVIALGRRARLPASAWRSGCRRCSARSAPGLPSAELGARAAYGRSSAFAVGILVTALAALLPARRAARSPPVAAMRDAAHRRPVAARADRRRRGRRGRRRRRAAGRRPDRQRAGRARASARCWRSSAWRCSRPLVSRPVAGPLGRLLSGVRLPRPAGRQNSLRNPRRTAATAAALMIGLALVAAVGVLGSSLKDSVRKIAGRDRRRLHRQPDRGRASDQTAFQAVQRRRRASAR